MNKYSKTNETSRAHACVLLAAPLCSLALAVGIQASAGLEACPLCILQRLFLLAIAVAAGFSLWRPNLRTGYASVLIVAGLGVTVAAWHVHLQMSPPESLACAPTLTFTLENFGLAKALPLLFKGSGSCSTEVWTLHGVSFPELSVANFLIIGGVAVHRLRMPALKRKFLVIGE